MYVPRGGHGRPGFSLCVGGHLTGCKHWTQRELKVHGWIQMKYMPYYFVSASLLGSTKIFKQQKFPDLRYTVCGMHMYGECTHCKIQLYFHLVYNAKN